MRATGLDRLNICALPALKESACIKAYSLEQGVFTTEPSEQVRGGKINVEKLLEMFLTRVPKYL